MFTFKIFGITHSAKTFAEAKSLYDAERDDTGLGSRDWMDVSLSKDGKIIGWFSYNGRVWASKNWTPETKEILEA